MPAAKIKHAVVIAGAGPAGLMLAGELALAEIDVVVIERRASQDLVGRRAGGLHARTLGVLDQRGIAGRFLAEGQKAQVAGFAGVRLDISGFPTRHNYVLGLWQNQVRRLRRHTLGRPGSADRRPVYRRVGASGARAGCGSRRRVDPARRTRRVGRRRRPAGARRRVDCLVRGAGALKAATGAIDALPHLIQRLTHPRREGAREDHRVHACRIFAGQRLPGHRH